jgi:hypothetical protein
VEQALDLADAVDLLRPVDNCVDQVLRRNLARSWTTPSCALMLIEP